MANPAETAQAMFTEILPHHESTMTSGSESNSDPVPHSAELEQIRLALNRLQFGSIHIVVQDGVIVQIERTEKLRFKSSRQRD